MEDEGSHRSHGTQSWAVIPAIGIPIHLLSFAALPQSQPSLGSAGVHRVRSPRRMHPADPPRRAQSPSGAACGCHRIPGRAARVRWGGKTPTPLIEGLEQACVMSVVRRERKSSQPAIWKGSRIGWIKAGTQDLSWKGLGHSYSAGARQALPYSLLPSPVEGCSVLSRVFLGFCSLSVCL